VLQISEQLQDLRLRGDVQRGRRFVGDGLRDAFDPRRRVRA
jgi:hypothetical protein